MDYCQHPIDANRLFQANTQNLNAKGRCDNGIYIVSNELTANMNRQLRLIILGIVLIILIDTIGSITSRAMGFDYGYFAILSALNYGVIGYLTTKYYNLFKAFVIGSVLGVFDVTVGWQISVILDANAEGLEQEVGTGVWIVTMIFGIGFAVLFGQIGGWIYRKTRRKEALPTTLR